MLKPHLAAQLNMIQRDQKKKATKHEYKAQTTVDLTINHNRHCKVQRSHTVKLFKTTLCWVFIWVTGSNNAHWKARRVGNQGKQYNRQTQLCNQPCPPMDSKWRCHLLHKSVRKTIMSTGTCAKSKNVRRLMTWELQLTQSGQEK